MAINNQTTTKSGIKDQYAIEICPNKIAFAHVTSGKLTKPMIRACDFRLYNSSADLLDSTEVTKAILSIIDKHGLRQEQFTLVLQPAYYRLFLLDLPKVPPDETRAAIRWQIKDMIDFPIDDAIVDCFPPSWGIDPCRKKIYTVVARSSFLMKLYDSLKNNQVAINSIYITELVIRNLMSQIPTEQNVSTAMLQITTDDIALIITFNNEIYFIRRIPISLFRNNENINVNQACVDEIRRSLDYCQSELKQEQPNKLYIAPLVMEHRTIVENALQNLGIATEFIDLNKITNSVSS